MQQARTISGTIRFQNVTRSAQNVTVYVRIDETSHADAAAARLAEVVLHGVSIFPGSPPLGFTMRELIPRASGRYSVRVHADVDGDGRVSRGDYISMQSYPVLLTGENSDVIDIVAREVR
jgi:hypothetical protein